MYQVLKRDGGVVEFEISKISAAMIKAFDSQNRKYHPSIINMLALQVSADFEPKVKDGFIAVEDIQDSVENVLSAAGYADVAKAYILYRKQREKVRNVGSTLVNYKDIVDNYLQINDWRVKEN
ncbi:MAG: ribonucleoside triphosphate reductase, partial [Clostridia bacterium]|nr:ribonucleoside triphosphate reductase [Clostridia bacterium]